MVSYSPGFCFPLSHPGVGSRDLGVYLRIMGGTAWLIIVGVCGGLWFSEMLFLVCGVFRQHLQDVEL